MEMGPLDIEEENKAPQETQELPVRHSIWRGFANGVKLGGSTIYLSYIILTIPLSFELGGLNCGLAYSLTILLTYFTLATIRVFTSHNLLTNALYYLQYLLLPTILSFFLTMFQINSEISVDTFWKRIWWNQIIKSWKLFLMNSTPLFTILEGFCSLLSIQAFGQVTQYLIRRRSDTWLIINLVLSACILSTSCYFVFKLYANTSTNFNLEHVGLINASLLGCAFTLTTLITIYAIYSNRANTVESSLMVAYIVKCCYELFPEISKSNINNLFKFIFNEFKKIDNQTMNWNNPLINLKQSLQHGSSFNVKLSGIVSFLFKYYPQSFNPLWDFLKISLNNITFSILTQLAYRICVFFAATKIIPLLSVRSNDGIKNSTNNKSSQLIYLYSPCIIIAVYTNLMIQYNHEFDEDNQFWNWLKIQVFNNRDVHIWQFWNWINIFAVLVLYFSELISNDPKDTTLTSHWD